MNPPENAQGLLVITARVRLKTTEEGGRESGIAAGYRPNHILNSTGDIKEGTWIGDIHFSDDRFYPGETKIVTVRFLRHPFVEEYLKVGRKWFINEGARNVGEGEVLEIVALS